MTIGELVRQGRCNGRNNIFSESWKGQRPKRGIYGEKYVNVHTKEMEQNKNRKRVHSRRVTSEEIRGITFYNGKEWGSRRRDEKKVMS